MRNQAHDFIFRFFRIGNLNKFESLFFPRSLHIEISEIKKRLHDTLRLNSNILHFGQAQFGNHPIEQPFLSILYDSSVSDNPDVKGVESKRIHNAAPDKKKVDACHKEEEGKNIV